MNDKKRHDLGVAWSPGGDILALGDDKKLEEGQLVILLWRVLEKAFQGVPTRTHTDTHIQAQSVGLHRKTDTCARILQGISDKLIQHCVDQGLRTHYVLSQNGFGCTARATKINKVKKSRILTLILDLLDVYAQEMRREQADKLAQHCKHSIRRTACHDAMAHQILAVILLISEHGLARGLEGFLVLLQYPGKAHQKKNS